MLFSLERACSGEFSTEWDLGISKASAALSRFGLPSLCGACVGNQSKLGCPNSRQFSGKQRRQWLRAGITINGISPSAVASLEQSVYSRWSRSMEADSSCAGFELGRRFPLRLLQYW